MSRILAGLNPAQQAAAQDTEGPVLILAGAGSGKTRTLTHRVAYLIEQERAPAERILVVTFTNRAARELRERLQGLLGEQEAGRVWAMTFHALCLRMLRQSGQLLGIPNHFSVLDTGDTRKLLQEAARQLEDPAADSAEELRRVRSLISRAKNAGQGPESLSGPLGERTATLWRHYAQSCKDIGALDFDDLLISAVRLLEHEHGATLWDSRFRYVMVDEYQDVNRVQEQLLRGLCQQSNNLCVVGDDAQSVYAFRGAEVEHILEFQQRWPDCHVHRLEENYRSSAAILSAAQAVIDHAHHRSDKRLVPTKSQGAPVRLLRFATHWDEAAFVGDRIHHLLREGVQPEDIAVAYRTNAQSQALEEALAERRIDYQVIGGVSFLRRSEIQNTRAYLALLANPRDRLALERAAGWPRRGLGAASLRLVAEGGGDLLASLRALLDADKLKGKAATGGRELLAVLDAARGRMDGPLDELLRQLMREAGIVRMLRASGERGADQLANLDGLVETAERYAVSAAEALPAWLADTALAEQQDDQPVQGVRLMTLHATKGLEFPYVFLTGLEEELFLRGEVLRKQLEEERRLLFVGMTRAERELVLTLADTRRLWGREMHTQPLQFLFDLPQEVIRQRAQPRPRKSAGRRRAGGRAEPSLAASAPHRPERPQADASVSGSDFPPGTQVEHPRFGRGVVVAASAQRLQVRFGDRTRQLQPQYARLRRV